MTHISSQADTKRFSPPQAGRRVFKGGTGLAPFKLTSPQTQTSQETLNVRGLSHSDKHIGFLRMFQIGLRKNSVYTDAIGLPALFKKIKDPNNQELELSATKRERDTLKERNAKLEQQLAAMHNVYEILANDHREQQGKLAKAIKSTRAFQELVEASESDYVNLQDEVNSLKKTILSTMSAFESISEQHSNRGEEIGELREQLRGAEFLLDKYTKIIKGHEEAQTKLNRRLGVSKTKIDDLRNALADEQQARLTTMDERDEAINERDALSSQNEALSRQNGLLQNANMRLRQRTPRDSDSISNGTVTPPTSDDEA